MQAFIFVTSPEEVIDLVREREAVESKVIATL